MIIREATPQDWDTVWPLVQEAAAAGETYAFPRDLGRDAAHALWMTPPPDRVLVAVDTTSGPSVLGTARLGPNRPGPGAHVATASFVVASSARGRGVGRALGAHVLDEARAQGYAAMQFNAVVESNVAAVALWRSLGFDVVGTVPAAFTRPSGERVGLHVMHRFL